MAEHTHHRHYERGQVWRVRAGRKMRRRDLEGRRVRIDFLSHCVRARYCVAIVTVLEERPPPPASKPLAASSSTGVTINLRDLGELVSDG